MVSRLWDSAKKRVTDCAICGPMPWISLMSCSVAASSLSMLPKREARSWAARSPTIRMPRPFSRRESPRVFEPSIAATRLLADFSASRSSSASASAVSP